MFVEIKVIPVMRVRSVCFAMVYECPVLSQCHPQCPMNLVHVARNAHIPTVAGISLQPRTTRVQEKND